jgi:tellurite resistance protein TehA-like permease
MASNNGDNIKSTLAHLGIEMFFAILPLVVLSLMWPSASESPPKHFWTGPEVSMTSCVLFGLTLARFLQGLFVTARNSKGEIRHAAAIYALFATLPLLGVIFSIILISKLSVEVHGSLIPILQVFLFFSSVLAFIVLGGYGVSRFETKGVNGDGEHAA